MLIKPIKRVEVQILARDKIRKLSCVAMPVFYVAWAMQLEGVEPPDDISKFA